MNFKTTAIVTPPPPPQRRNPAKPKTALITAILILLSFAVTALSMTGCKDDGDSEEEADKDKTSVAKSITVTGITGGSSVQIVINSDLASSASSAGGKGTISNGSVTVKLYNINSNGEETTTAFTGSGLYYVILYTYTGTIESDPNGKFYCYTESGGSTITTEEEAFQKMKKVSITGATTTIAFNKFQEVDIPEDEE